MIQLRSAVVVCLGALSAVACFSPGASEQALGRIPPADAPAPSTASVPHDALVDVAFSQPTALTAIDGNGSDKQLPPTRRVVGRVSRRFGDTLWIAVAQSTDAAGSVTNYPARGAGARMVVVPRESADTPAFRVVNAHPRQAEVLATSALVGGLTLLALIAFMLMNYTEAT